MVGRGKYHLTTQKLKNWILLDVPQILDLDRVDNTSDVDKPLSINQKQYVDLREQAIRDTFNPAILNLNQTKADLVNGMISLSQLPITMLDNHSITVNMIDIQNEIQNKISNNNVDYVDLELDRKIEEHKSIDDPHSIKPYVDSKVVALESTLTTTINSELASKVDNARLPENISIQQIDDFNLKISVRGTDGIVRSVTLPLT